MTHFVKHQSAAVRFFKRFALPIAAPFSGWVDETVRVGPDDRMVALVAEDRLLLVGRDDRVVAIIGADAVIAVMTDDRTVLVPSTGS